MSWIYDLEPQDLTKRMVASGYPKFRAAQIQSWLVKGYVRAEDMHNLPRGLQQDLNLRFSPEKVAIVRVQRSRLDDSRKFLIRIDDEYVEAVIMRYDYGNTLCLSSQIGCRMGCTFCASTGAGFLRNLTAGEMLAQYAFTRRESGLSIERVVIMGIGEPLENLQEVLSFIRRLNAEYGISKRRIAVSTCGLVPAMEDLAAAGEPVTLAISLHSAIQAKRARIMPVARRYPLDELLTAARDYRLRTGRRISYEYLMIRGFNDGDEDLAALLAALRRAPGHVNLIPLNEHSGMTLRPSPEERFEAFLAGVEEAGFPVSRRRSLGQDIEAACGQLRRNPAEGAKT